MSHLDFKAIIASRGYHVYKETPWSNAKVIDKVKTEIKTNQSLTANDPYACAVKAKHKYFNGWETVGHVPREISKYTYFFIKKESRSITGNVKSLTCKPSPVSSRGPEIPLLLTCSCPDEWIRNKMKDFINDFYIYDFTGIVHIYNSSDKSDFENDLELTEKEDAKEENETSVSVVDDKVISKSLHQETARVVINND